MPLLPIDDVAARVGIPAGALYHYGPYKAKLAADYIGRLPQEKAGKLILVTAISPTPAGEGKTTTTIGLGDALTLMGKKTIICLREPSLGPCFGIKGGATGGGRRPMRSTCTSRAIFTRLPRPTTCFRR
jgi:formate--tetrahydrofolate ligase